ncbi:MAG TPA: hypothetical protein VK601_23685 [Kofleriaceae bacterium]|nr:hypothetical protein [Kofleriaceae bacterium]
MTTWYVGVLVVGAAGVMGCGSVKAMEPSVPPPDAASDGPADASTDSAPVAVIKYDVAYINDLTLTTSISNVHGILLVVNKGTAPLKLSTAAVVTYSNDFPGITWEFSKNGATTTMLVPGHAAGAIGPDVTAKLVDSGLVPEPIDDNTLDFTMTFPMEPPSGLTLHAQAVLQIESANIVLPFTLEIVGSGSPSLNATSRVTSKD